MDTTEDQGNKAIIDLLSSAKGKNGLDLARLRDEVRSKIAAGDKTLSQFLKLLETFQEIIPNEKQRYSAALKALSATSGLGIQDVIESSDAQLRELKRVEDAVLSSMKEYGDELKEMDSRLGSIRAETATLRERMLALEKEEKELIGAMAAQVKMRKGVEQTAGKVLAEIGAEIADIRNKTEKHATEESAPREAAASAAAESEIPRALNQGVPEENMSLSEMREGLQQDVPEASRMMSELEEMISPPATENQKKCPMCEGPLNFYADSATWICYTCGHEVSDKDINPDSD